MKLNAPLERYVNDKLGELDKFIQVSAGKPDLVNKAKPTYEAFVEIERTTKHHRKGKIFRAECQIKLPGKIIRAESTKRDIRLAVDEIKDELQRELKKYKNKRDAIYKRAARKAKRVLKFSPLAFIRKRKK